MLGSTEENIMSDDRYKKMLMGFDTFGDCLRGAIDIARAQNGLSQAQIATKAGINISALSKALNNSSNIDPNKIPALCNVLGNNFLVDWLAYKAGVDLIVPPDNQKNNS